MMNDKVHDSDAEDYAVIFRGDIVVGHVLLEVKQQLQRLFKVDAERINTLFSGRPVCLKRHLSKVEAERYQQVLRQAGAIAFVERCEKDNNYSESHTQGAQSASGWELAPPGSELSLAVESEPQEEVKTDHISVAPQQGNLLTDDEQPPQVAVEIKTDHLSVDEAT